MQIAYLVNQYPKTSHSFIRREIQALETLGLSVKRYTLRHTSEPLADPADKDELPRTEAVIGNPLVTHMLTGLGTIARQPINFLKTAWLAMRLGMASDRPALMHLVYLLEAAVIAGWMKRDAVSHLHVHFGTNSAAVGLFAHRLSGIPWSFTVHGPEEFDRAPMLALREKAKSSSFIACVSSFGRSQFWRWIDFADWQKVKVIHCGLDQSFLEAPEKSAPLQPHLICIGRLSEQKGQMLLVEAAHLLRQRGIDFTITLVGDGPLRRELEAAVARHGLQSSIIFAGWRSGAEVRNEIMNARALVLPSFAEGLPVVIMEAMALERPVVTTYIAGIPELVIDGECGWLVPAGDAETLADAMAEALSAPAERMRLMGSEARRRALLRHDALTEAKKLKALFEESL